MLKGHIIKFSIDLPRVSDEQFKELIRLGEYENMGLGLRRWVFPISHVKKVEEIIGDRISFGVRHIREHILEDSSLIRKGTSTRISISKGQSAGKVEEVRFMKDLVADILANDEYARSSDKWLYLRVLKELGYDVYADYQEVQSLPSWETVSRIRRKFQEIGMFPADSEIDMFRKDNESQMRRINEWF